MNEGFSSTKRLSRVKMLQKIIMVCVVVVVATSSASGDDESDLLDQMRNLQLPSIDAEDFYSSHGQKNHYRFRSPRSIRFDDDSSNKKSSDAVSATFGLGPSGLTGSVSAASADPTTDSKTKLFGLGGYPGGHAPYYPPPGHHGAYPIHAGGHYPGGHYPPGGVGFGGSSSSAAAASSSSGGVGVGGVPYLKPVTHGYDGYEGYPHGGVGGYPHGGGGYPGYGVGYPGGGYGSGGYGYPGGYGGGYGNYYQPNYHAGGVYPHGGVGGPGFGGPGGFYGQPGPYGGFRKGEGDNKSESPELSKSNSGSSSKSTVTFKDQ